MSKAFADASDFVNAPLSTPKDKTCVSPDGMEISVFAKVTEPLTFSVPLVGATNLSAPAVPTENLMDLVSFERLFTS